MNFNEVKRKIMKLRRSSLTEKTYPIPSDWVPIADVGWFLAGFRVVFRWMLIPSASSLQRIEGNCLRDLSG
jgi:hypothetical protein